MRPLKTLLLALLVIAAVLLVAVEGRRVLAQEKYEVTLTAGAPIEIVGQPKVGELPPPPPPGYCADCADDRLLGDALAKAWDELPPHIIHNDRFTFLSGRRMVQTCAGLCPAAPPEVLWAAIGDEWLLSYYQDEIVRCRGSQRPCILRRTIGVGPSRNQWRCQMWVGSSSVVAALLRTARDEGLLGDAEQGRCPPSMTTSAMAAGDAELYSPVAPDPGLYLGGTSPIHVFAEENDDE